MKYWYCDGTSLESVNVTILWGASCIYDNFSEGEYCNYRQYMKTYTVTLSHALTFDLYVRYTYDYYMEHNYQYEGSGTGLYGYILIPAGSTSKSDKILCREERWCVGQNDVYQNQYQPLIQQMV